MSHLESTQAIKFNFHMDPRELPGRLRPQYATMQSFRSLCSKETPEPLIEYLWRQFVLHRAVSTLNMVEDLFLDKHKLIMRNQNTWEQSCIDEILRNVQNKIYKMTKLQMSSRLSSSQSLNRMPLKRSTLHASPKDKKKSNF